MYSHSIYTNDYDQSLGLDNGYKKGNICQKQEYNVSMVTRTDLK